MLIVTADHIFKGVQSSISDLSSHGHVRLRIQNSEASRTPDLSNSVLCNKCSSKYFGGLRFDISESCEQPAQPEQATAGNKWRLVAIYDVAKQFRIRNNSFCIQIE